MTVSAKFPLTLTERLDLGPGVLRFPATWEEYLEVLEEAEYPVEFDNNEIIAMSIASNPHEAIVVNISGILYQLFGDDPAYFYASSNRHIFLKEFQADYAPDAQVVKGAPIEYILRKGLTANLNPCILFEVLPPSTRDLDLGVKLPRYKKIPSVRQIVFIDQTHPLVTVYTRIENTNRWENQDFDNLDQSFLIEDQPVFIKDLYKKVVFEIAG